VSATEDRPALRRHGDTMVRPGDADHAVNVLAGGPPPWVAAALADALADHRVTRYPDPAAALGAVADLHGRHPDEVVLTNGGAEALWLLGPALSPRRAALLQPGFTETEAALHAHGIPVVRVRSAGEIPADADLVVLTNPASPTGALRQRADVLALREPGRILVVDEAFMSMVPGETESLARQPLEDVIVVRSLTKLLSVPGLRVGYALAPAPLTARLHRVRPPWAANAMALAVITAAAEHRHELAGLAVRAASEREDLISALAAIPGVAVFPSHTNFVLIRVPDGAAVVRALRDRAIAVRPADSFPGFGPDHIRVTARDSAANRRLAVALAESLEAL
jgi:histidinol-phosphate/aromatic aminotransferase/cobyric acid decarboxylase-like protein